MDLKHHRVETREDKLNRTLALIRRKIRNGSTAREVFLLARQAVRDVPERDELGEINAVANAIKDRVRFTRDVWGVETIQDAQDTLKLGTGDCDDYTVLVGAALQSLGYPVGFEIVGKEPGRYTHIMPRVMTRTRGQVPVDLVRPDGRFTSPQSWPQRRVFPPSSSLYGKPVFRAWQTRGKPKAQPRSAAMPIAVSAPVSVPSPSTIELPTLSTLPVAPTRPSHPSHPARPVHELKARPSHPVKFTSAARHVQTRVSADGKRVHKVRDDRGRSMYVEDDQLGSWLSSGIEWAAKQTLGTKKGKKVAKALESGTNAAFKGVVQAGQMVASVIPGVGQYLSKAGDAILAARHVGEDPRKMSISSIQEVGAANPEMAQKLYDIKMSNSPGYRIGAGGNIVYDANAAAMDASASPYGSFMDATSASKMMSASMMPTGYQQPGTVGGIPIWMILAGAVGAIFLLKKKEAA